MERSGQPLPSCETAQIGPELDLKVLDLRQLPPPMPMLQALQAADGLPSGGSVVVLTPLWPAPLFASLAERGLAWQAVHEVGGGARVLIQRPHDDA